MSVFAHYECANHTVPINVYILNIVNVVIENAYECYDYYVWPYNIFKINSVLQKFYIMHYLK